MSSNIKLVRNCEYCKGSFIAKTTTTRFCDRICNSRFYKAKNRAAKISESNLESTLRETEHKIRQINKEILTVKEAGVLLNSSASAIYAMINTGRLKAANFAKRKTMILRSDLMNLFNLENHVGETIFKKIDKIEKPEGPPVINQSNSYTIEDLVPVFGQSREVLYTTLSRKKIPKVKIGKNILFSKTAVDQLIRDRDNPREKPLDAERKANERIKNKGLKINECYNIDECVKRFSKSRGLLYGIFKRHNIPKLKIGKQVYLSKVAIDRLLRITNNANKIAE